MVKGLITILTVVAAIAGLAFTGGCQNDAQTGSVVGALAGSGIGQLAGGDTESTLIGAAVGGGIGYMLGNESERKKAAVERDAIRAEQNTVVVWITNSNRSRVPVRLKKSGPYYIGPRGETYNQLPTEDQLRPVYGF